MIFLLLCCASLAGKAQDMALNQLKSVIGRPVSSITDSLVKKGWSVRPELSDIQGNQLYQTFSFGSLKTEDAKALSWFRIHADNGIINQLYYQTPGKELFTVLLDAIVKSGAEKRELKNIEENQVGTYYVATDFIYETIMGVDNYTVMVSKRPD